MSRGLAAARPALSALAAYRGARRLTERLCEPLSPEDCCIQTIEDVSPPKWHLGHTTWFFEEMVLSRHCPAYEAFDPAYRFLFNSYYESLGARVERRRRGWLSRPLLSDIYAYRRAVDRAMARFLERAPERLLLQALPSLEIGINHEQQHQELLLTDIKHILGSNPILPAYLRLPQPSPCDGGEGRAHFEAFDAGLREIGWERQAFAFDNERPRHTVWLDGFELSDRCVTNGDYLDFIADGGYRDPRLWHSDGWALAQAEGWQAPLYWLRGDGGWKEMTLAGPRELDRSSPVCHISWFEAAAYAAWASARLPTEQEWEAAASERARFPGGPFLEDELFQPGRARGGFADMLGNVWEWTASAYVPYPGFRPFDGALAEYNGKFMSGQMVLRGGSCATPRGHVRPTYRNFFKPGQRWQFSGLRLAR